MIGLWGRAKCGTEMSSNSSSFGALQSKLTLSASDQGVASLPVKVVEGMHLFDADNANPILKKKVQVGSLQCHKKHWCAVMQISQ